MEGAGTTGGRRGGAAAGMLAAALLACACSKQAPVEPYAPSFSAAPARGKVPEYAFGVTPMSNFRNIYEDFQPIVEYLNGGLGDARLVLEVPRGLDEHAQQLKNRRFAFALSNPYHSLNAVQHDGYRIFAKMGEDDAFRGVWIVRRGSGIAALADLKGRKVSFPPRSALAATMMTRLQLKEAGIDPHTDVSATYLGSQHASIMAVHEGAVDAGATWPLAWTAFQRSHPREAATLEARFPTAPLINQAIVARDDVPPAVVARVGELMSTMHTTEKGRALLARVPTARFEPAGAAQYDKVRVFMDKYRQAFPQAAD